MWPWEHLAVGYILYSLWLRRRRGTRRPVGGTILVLAFATQLPDLVDKPLGWGTTFLPGGHSLMHSLFVAIPVVTVVWMEVSRRNRSPLGAAFGIGYLSHLPGDVVYPFLTDGILGWRFLFWPAIPADNTVRTDVLGRGVELFGEYVAFLGTPRGLGYLGVEAVLLGTAITLWYADGLPGLSEARLVVRALIVP